MVSLAIITEDLRLRERIFRIGRWFLSANPEFQPLSPYRSCVGQPTGSQKPEAVQPVERFFRPDHSR